LHIHLLQLGRVGYTEGLEIQARVVAARKAGAIGDTLLLLEHPPVITLGRNALRKNVLVSDEWLAARGIELHEVNRGGDVTYHGPGQLVGYPIVDLRGEWPGKRGPHLGPVDFVRMLEEVLIRTCGEFGAMAKRVKGCTGVWTFGGQVQGSRFEVEGEERPQKQEQMRGSFDSVSRDEIARASAQDDGSLEKRGSAQDDGGLKERKLAAIGVHVSQGVTSHGFALNVTPDLRDFEWIIPCGITDRGVTSLELEAVGEVSMEQAANAVARNFGRVFGRQMVACESLDQLLEGANDGG
jgi:lipoyl(octanoyl) transferase